MDAPPSPSNRCHVDLLWTGGWDSTFRLLQLLLVHRVPVVPWYLCDGTRPSTPVELGTMQRIADRLRADHPHTRELLRPLRVASVEDVPVDDGILAALRAIRERSYIGSQYAWLPAFCEERGIADMELGVHVDDKVQALLRGFTIGFVHPCGFHSLRVDPRHAGTPEHRLFGLFSLPLFDIDKVGIAKEAESRGWEALMDMTWFCHTPVRGRPCGLCAPCVYTIEEGLAHRVPTSRRALSFLYRRLALPWKAPVRQLRASLGSRRDATPPHG